MLRKFFSLLCLSFFLTNTAMLYGATGKPTVKEVRYGSHDDKSRIVVDLSGDCKERASSGCRYSLTEDNNKRTFTLTVKGAIYKKARAKGRYGKEIGNVVITPIEDGLTIKGKILNKGLKAGFFRDKPNLIILDISRKVAKTETAAATSTDKTAARKKSTYNSKWKLKIPKEEITKVIETMPVRRGVHLTGYWAGGASLRKKLIKNIRGTVLNTVVIALKEMDGKVFINGVEKAKEYKAYYGAIAEPEKMVQDFKDAGLYTIGRIAVFKDDILPVKRPDLAVKTPDGNIWKDRKGKMWADQYSREVWDYNIDVALSAVEAGFDEIQFDYIRYPTEGNISLCRYSEPEHSWDKARVNLVEFLKYARSKIPDHILISIDTFGLTLSEIDNKIGQDMELLAQYADYIYPMMYPSHYYRGHYGLRNPNAEPYKVIEYGLSDAMARLETNYAKIRPYLQDFSQGKPKYGPNELGEQIKALRANHLHSWILWNAANKYTWSALSPEYYKNNIDPDYKP